MPIKSIQKKSYSQIVNKGTDSKCLELSNLGFFFFKSKLSQHVFYFSAFHEEMATTCFASE